MGTIQFKEVNCKNCYKCIRNCPVKAISLKDNHAQVIESGCVLCGKCLQVCPQNAKSVESELEKVRGFISKKLKVYASIAPSFVPAFNVKNISSIGKLFGKLGFTYVEETAVGAARVTESYRKLIEESRMTNVISTACPTLVSLVEKHYPELIDQLAPVVSPMVAHGKMMKDFYGSRIKVVFIGPCLAKKEEYKDEYGNKAIDAVLTYDEFEKWLYQEGLSFEDCEDESEEMTDIATRFYPAPGGIIKSLGSLKKYKYKPIKFDGIERCMEALDWIKNGEAQGYFVEMNTCAGGCLNGVCMNSDGRNFIVMREKLIDYVHEAGMLSNKQDMYDKNIDLFKKMRDKSTQSPEPDEETIKKVLAKIGKFSKDEELNCGSCGYSTCREKAIAVINGKAEIYMCLPFMRERAESISNVILQSTPNALFALTEELDIQEANSTAKKMFKLENEDLSKKKIYEIINCPDIFTVLETRKNIYDQKYNYENYSLIVEQSILYNKENHILLLVIKDITRDEKKQMQLHDVQKETVEIAQKVIDKQMRVAQEIASLLGETTAETKVALTKLKNSIQTEMGEG